MSNQNANREQAEPTPGTGRPVWSMVIEEIAAETKNMQSDLDWLKQRQDASEEDVERLTALSKRVAACKLLLEDMRERDAIGRRRYGVPLQANNGRDALMDAYQESLDLAVYLRQSIAERVGASSATSCRAGESEKLHREICDLRVRCDSIGKQRDGALMKAKLARDSLNASRELCRSLLARLNNQP